MEVKVNGQTYTTSWRPGMTAYTLTAERRVVAFSVAAVSAFADDNGCRFSLWNALSLYSSEECFASMGELVGWLEDNIIDQTKEETL